jgi:hypothetical protein
MNKGGLKQWRRHTLFIPGGLQHAGHQPLFIRRRLQHTGHQPLFIPGGLQRRVLRTLFIPGGLQHAGNRPLFIPGGLQHAGHQPLFIPGGLQIKSESTGGYLYLEDWYSQATRICIPGGLQQQGYQTFISVKDYSRAIVILIIRGEFQQGDRLNLLYSIPLTIVLVLVRACTLESMWF